MSTQHVHLPTPIAALVLALCLSVTMAGCQPAAPGPTAELTLENPLDPEPVTQVPTDTDQPPTPGATLEEIPLESPTDPNPETLTPTDTDQPPAPSPTPGLILEEHLLQNPPNPDTMTFQPVGTSQQTVLAKHQSERKRTVYNIFFQIESSINPRTKSLGPGQGYLAVLDSSSEEPYRQSVTLVNEDGKIVTTLDAGLPSPALPLRSLWSFGDHWVLEILFVEEDLWEGRIYQDGELLNTSRGYQETFGFQLLGGKPFYFFRGENGLGYHYKGHESSLPYDEIPHYNCCSLATINPTPAENMVAFFALRGEDWYYVELGIFNED